MTFKGLAWVRWAQKRNLLFIEAQQQELCMNVCACVSAVSVCVCVCVCQRECLWVQGDQANLLPDVLDLAFG